MICLTLYTTSTLVCPPNSRTCQHFRKTYMLLYWTLLVLCFSEVSYAPCCIAYWPVKTESKDDNLHYSFKCWSLHIRVFRGKRKNLHLSQVHSRNLLRRKETWIQGDEVKMLIACWELACILQGGTGNEFGRLLTGINSSEVSEEVRFCNNRKSWVAVSS